MAKKKIKNKKRNKSADFLVPENPKSNMQIIACARNWEDLGEEGIGRVGIAPLNIAFNGILICNARRGGIAVVTLICNCKVPTFHNATGQVHGGRRFIRRRHARKLLHQSHEVYCIRANDPL